MEKHGLKLLLLFNKKNFKVAVLKLTFHRFLHKFLLQAQRLGEGFLVALLLGRMALSVKDMAYSYFIMLVSVYL